MSKQVLLTEKDHAALQKQIRWVNRNKNITPNYRRRGGPFVGAGGGNNIRRAKLQSTMIVNSETMTLNDAVKEGWLIIKLLDSSGTVIGSGENGKYKCYVKLDQSATNAHLPFAADDSIGVIKIFSAWYLYEPDIHRTMRAKTTAAWSSGTTTTANLLDADGNEITEEPGAGITVNFFETYSANIFPPIPNDKTIPVFLDTDDKWYCLWGFITAVEVDNVLVEFNIDTSTYKFQTKKRDNVMVLAADAISDYVDEHTGTVCP